MNNSNKKVISIIIIILALILIGGSLLLTLNNKNSDNNNNNNIDNNDNSSTKITDKKKKLRHISPDDLDDESAKEIVQLFLDEEETNENWIVESASLNCTDDNNGFVVNIVAQKEGANWYRQTIITYKNNEWSIELPMWQEGEKDISSYSTYYSIGE
jgi:uncharacterized protein YxeA